MINVAVIYHSRPTSKLYMPSVITVQASQFPNLSATETGPLNWINISMYM